MKMVSMWSVADPSLARSNNISKPRIVFQNDKPRPRPRAHAKDRVLSLFVYNTFFRSYFSPWSIASPLTYSKKRVHPLRNPHPLNLPRSRQRLQLLYYLCKLYHDFFHFSKIYQEFSHLLLRRRLHNRHPLDLFILATMVRRIRPHHSALNRPAAQENAHRSCHADGREQTFPRSGT
jgi:hypothetical protein